MVSAFTIGAWVLLCTAGGRRTPEMLNHEIIRYRFGLRVSVGISFSRRIPVQVKT